MTGRPIVAVVGEAVTEPERWEIARELGERIARKGWILVTGGLSGIMEAASRGAAEAGGAVVGILPQGSTEAANKFVTVPIATNMGHARNVIIAHTADMMVAVGGSLGTLSEIAIARKLGKPVFSIRSWEVGDAVTVKDAAEAVEACQRHLDLLYATIVKKEPTR
ncbi:MAG TPA: TIGR00725 family protein [bacterium]|nr:TIGR00725 family protein [bacterium]